MKIRLTIPLLLLILGCTANPSQPAAAPAASVHKNLQVLPRDLTRDQLIAIMRTFNRSLGVKCNHCHVVTATEPKEQFDFPSDAKEEKRVARVMIQMTNQINGAWLDRVEQAEGHPGGEPAAPAAASGSPAQPRVSCWTCHRGQVDPEMPPPPPAPPAAPAR
jgi:hypothetical protein